MQIIEPLRIPAVARLWAGLSLPAVGDQLHRMALIWLSARLLGSEAGLVTAAVGVVTIGVAPFGGALADAWDMRRTMIGVDLARAAVALRRLRRELPVLHAPSHGSPRRRLDLLAAGFRAVAAHPVFVYLLARGAIVNGLWVLSLWICLSLVIEQRQLSGFGMHGLGVIGLVRGCYGVGNVIGSLRAPRPLPMIFAGNVVVGLGLLGLALARSAAPAGAVVPLLMLLAAATAIGGPLSDVPLSTLRQTEFGNHQIAAVYRLGIVADWSGIVLATAPWLLGDSSPAGVMILCGVVVLVAVIAGRVLATWWTRRGGWAASSV